MNKLDRIAKRIYEEIENKHTGLGQWELLSDGEKEKYRKAAQSAALEMTTT